MIEIPDHALSFIRDMCVAVRAAAKAGDEILRGYGRLYQIKEKGVGDFVCEIDIAADRAILEELRQFRPSDEIISEELSPSKVEKVGRCWVIDPLDATSAFIFEAGRSLPSVLVALREEATTRIGVVLFPLTGEWFYAIRGDGAYKNGARLSTKGRASVLQEAWVDMNQYGNAELETSQFARLRERLRSRDGARLVTSQPPHSGIVVRIAEGRKKISAVIHDNNKSRVKQEPWDTAAVQLVLEEAGGVFLNFHGERYDPFEPEPIVAAVSCELAMQILGLLES